MSTMGLNRVKQSLNKAKQSQMVPNEPKWAKMWLNGAEWG